jgi:heme oxygenase (biliverdin-IX-beta and delta-forming)
VTQQVGGSSQASQLKTAARALLERERFGVLATLATRRAGWPFASIAPYGLDAEGEPLFLLSDLAEHTRNLQADARASLLVQEPTEGDPQAAARLTLLGLVRPTEADGEAREQYFRTHPEAAAYLELDFRFYRMEVDQARFIAGFGDMGWISGAAFRA